MKVIALEGSSYAGKTTALRHLRASTDPDDVAIFSCYVQHFAEPQDIPLARTESAAQQIEAFEAFMRIEAARVAQVSARAFGTIVLDRSVDTLMAHARAMDCLYGFGVHAHVRRRLEDLAHLRPDHTIYLDVSYETLSLRRKAAGHVETEPEYFLHDPAFLAHTRAYFVRPEHLPVTREITVVPGEQPPEAVAGAVHSLVELWKR
ncbi:hypothetical protein GCM10010377_75740 [Streptomyces viridiviolaceus]|uniref:dTMP kinase n=1 Tax=Streptomyces viridiviolaceus TaxID=68282 RepID=A0ABW2DXH3_9ACTN|nr:hypothetical protein [Streptomyces viridiviolaceus]GHB74207.1 hypothetical protein GCM10010377_75740 [Streptomyces viridiviolaceus]